MTRPTLTAGVPRHRRFSRAALLAAVAQAAGCAGARTTVDEPPVDTVELTCSTSPGWEEDPWLEADAPVETVSPDEQAYRDAFDSAYARGVGDGSGALPYRPGCRDESSPSADGCFDGYDLGFAIGRDAGASNPDPVGLDAWISATDESADLDLFRGGWAGNESHGDVPDDDSPFRRSIERNYAIALDSLHQSCEARLQAVAACTGESDVGSGPNTECDSMMVGLETPDLAAHASVGVYRSCVEALITYDECVAQSDCATLANGEEISVCTEQIAVVAELCGETGIR